MQTMGVEWFLALDETKNVSFEGIPHMIMLKPCLYKGKVSDEELFKEMLTTQDNTYFSLPSKNKSA